MTVFNKNVLGFQEIKLDFVVSAQGAGHLTPEKGWGI